MTGRNFFFIISASTFLLSMIFIDGCTPTFITYNNGYPQPQVTNITWTQDKEVTASWFFLRWYSKRLISNGFSEFVEYPEILDSDLIHALKSDTIAVVMNLHIANPNKKKYRVVRVYTMGRGTFEDPVGWWTIRDVNNLTITGPVIPNKEIKMRVKIILEKYGSPDTSTIHTDELRYTIESEKT